MVNPIRYLTRNEYAYTPKKLDLKPDSEIGAVQSQFEAFEPNPAFKDMAPPPFSWVYPVITPEHIPSKFAAFDPIQRAMIDTLWKRGEVTAGATRGPVTIGARGRPASAVQGQWKEDQTFHPKVAAIGGKFAIDDWKYMDQIPRTNAVTMRGDSRPPSWVIGKDGGFHPPNKRTDEFYLYGSVFNYFQSYMKRRYDREISEQDYRSALNHVVPSPYDKKLLADYLMFRKIAEGEAFHLGRMVANEALKGYISTAKAFPVALSFGTRYFSVSGWVYITMVRGGFVVPQMGDKWGTKEQEIAQWGSIAAEDIVGFRRITPSGGTGPIWIRPSFRKGESKAFRKLFNMLSHWAPPGGGVET